MKLCVTWIWVILAMSCYAQKSDIKTTLIETEQNKQYELKAYYYPIAQNINNPYSALYISDHPSIHQVREFATRKPSYKFEIYDGDEHRYTLIYHQIPWHDGTGFRYAYLAIDQKTGKRKEILSKRDGEITQLRALELLKSKDQTGAKQMDLNHNDVLIFDNAVLGIQPYSFVKAELDGLIKKHKLHL